MHFHNMKFADRPPVLYEDSRFFRHQLLDIDTLSRGRPLKPSSSKSKFEGARPRRIIQSVDRALAIVDVLAQGRQALALVEISARTQLNVSTCHHLLATLQRRGFVVQDPRTKEYLLGNKVFELSDARERQLDFVFLARPVMDDLSRTTGEAIHLAVLDAGQLATLVKIEARHAVRVDATLVGKSNAAHASASGKALLAYLPKSELDAALANSGLTRFTEKTIRSREVLDEELARIRRQGYSEDYEEFQPGVLCFGAPVFNRDGRVLAALSCSLPTMRVTEVVRRRVQRLVVKAAKELSIQLGHAGGGADMSED
jgi:IclR family acetate operon transcriptional repressor